MEVTVLGTSAAWPGPGRASAGFLVRHEGVALALDLGTGTLSNLSSRCPTSGSPPWPSPTVTLTTAWTLPR